MKRIAAVLLLLCAAVALGGCGPGSGAAKNVFENIFSEKQKEKSADAPAVQEPRAP